MGLRLYSILLCLFLSQSIKAQVVLMIADETKTGFKLIVEDYLQNEVFLEKMNIKEIPNEESQIHFEMQDGRFFSRKLPELPKGFYKYVIYEDFEGKLKFRYRGDDSKLSQSALLFKYEKKNKYSFPEPAKVLVVNTEEKTPQKKPSKEAQDSSKASEAIAVISAEEIQEIPKVNPLEHASAPKEESAPEIVETNDNEKSTTLENPKPEKAASTEPSKAFDFEASLKSIEELSFEFDKLQMTQKLVSDNSLDSKQVLALLKCFKYDQSRLDLMRFYLEKHPNSKLDASLLNAFDFELSKQAAQNIIDGTENK